MQTGTAAAVIALDFSCAHGEAADGAEPAGGWGWVDGSALDYVNWAANQPDDQVTVMCCDYECGGFHPGATNGRWGDMWCGV